MKNDSVYTLKVQMRVNYYSVGSKWEGVYGVVELRF